MAFKLEYCKCTGTRSVVIDNLAVCEICRKTKAVCEGQCPIYFEERGAYIFCNLKQGHSGEHSWELKSVEFKSGAASTKVPRLDLIPYEALCRLADRFELGLERHKEKSWNARQNQQALEDKEWVIARAVHTIHHALKYIEKLEGRLADDGDDDAAAIMWAGACLIMAKKVQQK